jgi:hypothetical protein
VEVLAVDAYVEEQLLVHTIAVEPQHFNVRTVYWDGGQNRWVKVALALHAGTTNRENERKILKERKSNSRGIYLEIGDLEIRTSGDDRFDPFINNIHTYTGVRRPFTIIHDMSCKTTSRLTLDIQCGDLGAVGDVVEEGAAG